MSAVSGVGLWVLALALDVPAKSAEDCDALYYGEGRPRDLPKALACYRAEQAWTMVAIMQLNGEGTPVDVAAARASWKHLVSPQGFVDSDGEALDEILKAREVNPGAKGRRVQFCEDIAATTPSLDRCQRRSEDQKAATEAKQLEKLRGVLDPKARPAFDRAVAALRTFAQAEGARAYQEYIDGTIRNQAAMDQEALVRRNFMTITRALCAPESKGPAGGARSFVEADKELNSVYRERLRSYAEAYGTEAVGDAATAAAHRGYVAEYKAKARSAQHEWVRYRDAMGKLAAVRWPGLPTAEEAVRAQVTEDRIRELQSGEHD